MPDFCCGGKSSGGIAGTTTVPCGVHVSHSLKTDVGLALEWTMTRKYLQIYNFSTLQIVRSARKLWSQECRGLSMPYVLHVYRILLCGTVSKALENSKQAMSTCFP